MNGSTQHSPLELLAQQAASQQNNSVSFYASPNGPLSDSEGDGDGEKPGKKRKRNRVALSCTECRRRKIKCDRRIPCEACIRRGDTKSCCWETAVAPQPFAQNTAFKQLEARYTALEHFVTEKFGSAYPELQLAIQAAIAANPTTEVPTAAPVASTSAVTKPPAPSASIQAIEANATVPLSKRGQSRISRTGVDMETEDAANVLEDMAITHSLYRAATDGSHTFLSEDSYLAGVPPDSATPPIQLDVGDTTVLLPSTYHEHDGALFPVDEVLQRILNILPTRDVVLKLVTSVLHDVWLRGIMVKQVLLAELEEFWRVVDAGRIRQVDPAFLAVLLETMTAGYEIVEEEMADVCGIPIDDLGRLAPLWHDGAQQALHLANFTSQPQFRVVLAILLKWHPSMKQTPNTPIWSSIAVRHAQALNFDRLGKNPETMPRDSPGLPFGANALKRQIACRTWHSCVFNDVMASYKTCQFAVRSASEYTTPMPLNVNDVDLGVDIYVQERPPQEFTEGAVVGWKAAFASSMREFAQQVLQIITEPTKSRYDHIQEIDRTFRRAMEEELLSPLFLDAQMRAVMLSGFHYRLTRLHRAFAARGVTDARYRYSTQAAVESARAALAAIREIKSRKLWFVIMHTLGSVIVLFQHVWLTVDRGERLISSDDFSRDISDALKFFNMTCGGRSVIAKSAAMHAHRITTALQNALIRRSSASTPGSATSDSSSSETFGALLKRIADDMAASDPALNEEPVWRANAQLTRNGVAASAPLLSSTPRKQAPAETFAFNDQLFSAPPITANDDVMGQMLANIAMLPGELELEGSKLSSPSDIDWSQMLGLSDNF